MGCHTATRALLALALIGLLGACGGGGDTAGDTGGGDADGTTPDAGAPDVAPGDTAPDGSDDAPADVAVDEPPLGWAPFVRGTFNNWEATDALEYQGTREGAGVYAGIALLSPGHHEFKIADANWRLDTIYSAASDEQLLVALDTEIPLFHATGYGNNTEIDIENEAEHTFTLTVTPAAAGADEPSLVLVVTEGAVVDPGELPDDSRTETFDGTTYEAVVPQGAGAPVLDPTALYDALAIDVPAGESVQAVFGDNLDGFVEVWTQQYSSATRYWLKAGFLLSYCATLTDGELNDLERESTGTRILPYGVRNLYPDGVWDELVPHPGRRAVTVRVHSDVAKPLSVMPKLGMKRRTTTWERVDDTMVFALAESLRREGVPAFVAVAGDRPFRLQGADLEALPFLTERVNIVETDVKPLLTTTGPETEFRVVFAFGQSAAEAVAEARALVETDAVGAQQQATYDLLTASWLWTDDATYNRALLWAKWSAYGMVNQEFGTGIWAGLPWFKQNWGRDTFIALPGTLLVTGRFEEAKAVIREFAALQNVDAEDRNFGRIPNRVAGPDDIIYNTTDGTPWMVREIAETVRYTGDTAFADEMFPVVERYITGAIAHYVDADGFLAHDDADTWMDARFGPQAEYAWSARGDRAVEIQALWHGALRYGATLAQAAGQADEAAAWTALADGLRDRFRAAFWDADAERMADRVRADDSADFKVRPNQLLVVSIPLAERLVDDAVEARLTANAVGALLYEYGIASLAQTHEYFHPHHDDQPQFNKDAAYHNGTVWLWNAGFTVTALTRFGHADHAYGVTTHMARQVLEMGTRGSLSELVDAHPDADGAVILSGTYSQSWSVAEYARNGYQDYLGFRPNVPAGRLTLHPSPPTAWTTFDARVPFGAGAALTVAFARQPDGALAFDLALHGADREMVVELLLPAVDHARHRLLVPLAPGATATVTFAPDTATATVDGEAAAPEPALPSFGDVFGTLEYVEPNTDATFPTMEHQDYLEGVIEAGAFE